jgi:PAS domain S-box-containing protein
MAKTDPDHPHGGTALDTGVPSKASIDLSILRAIVDALPVLINAKDSDSRYLFMNAFQAHLYGVEPSKAVGRSAEELLGVGYGAYTRRLDRQVIDTGRPTDFYEESYADARGGVHDWLTRKVPLADADGSIFGVATIAMEMTERKGLERELLQARERAEAGSRAKSAFLAQMSHELRTPLNALIGFTELIAGQAMGPLGHPRYVEYAGNVLESATILLSLVNDLLDIAAIESGPLSMVEDWVNVEDLVHSVVTMQKGLADAAGVSVESAVGASIPHLRADARRLKQALINVLSNAIKYTPHGGQVNVRVDRNLFDDLVILVIDNGLGMSTDDCNRAMQPFVRLASAVRSSQAGTGLGLPIAKAITEAHGGRLEIQSSLDRGTQVALHLPANRLGQPDARGRKAQALKAGPL